MIDIILPTFNRRAFLPRAIECVREQTFRDWRLLIVNDGGEDVSDLINACHDERIVYFNRPHGGKAAQLNFALTQVTAPYITYMDDDDDVFPNHLERLMATVRETGADLVYSDTYLTTLDADGKVIHRTTENTLDAPWEEIRLYNRINHKQLLHKAELASEIGGYDEEMRILIDFDGIKRLVKAAKKPVHLKEVTGDHFQRMNPKTGEIQSISGLWQSDPAAAGRSLIRFFSKDPEALARLYRSHAVLEHDFKIVQEKLERKSRPWYRRLADKLSAKKGMTITPLLVWTTAIALTALFLVIGLTRVIPICGWDVLVRYAPMADAFADGRWSDAFHPRTCVLFQALTGSLVYLIGVSGLTACQVVAIVFWGLSMPALWAVLRRVFDDTVAYFGSILIFASAELFKYAGDGWRDDCRILPILLLVLGFQLTGWSAAAAMAAGQFLSITLRVDCFPIATLCLFAYAILCLKRRQFTRLALPVLAWLTATAIVSFVVYSQTGYFVPAPHYIKLLGGSVA